MGGVRSGIKKSARSALWTSRKACPCCPDGWEEKKSERRKGEVWNDTLAGVRIASAVSLGE